MYNRQLKEKAGIMSMLARVFLLLAFILWAFIGIFLIAKVHNHVVRWVDRILDGNDSRPLHYHVRSIRRPFLLATGSRDGGDGGDDGDVKTPLLLLTESEQTVFSVIMRGVPFVPQQRLYISAKQQRDLLRQEYQYGGVSQVYTLLSASVKCDK